MVRTRKYRRRGRKTQGGVRKKKKKKDSPRTRRRKATRQNILRQRRHPTRITRMMSKRKDEAGRHHAWLLSLGVRKKWNPKSPSKFKFRVGKSNGDELSKMMEKMTLTKRDKQKLSKMTLTKRDKQKLSKMMGRMSIKKKGGSKDSGCVCSNWSNWNDYNCNDSCYNGY